MGLTDPEMSRYNGDRLIHASGPSDEDHSPRLQIVNLSTLDASTRKSRHVQP
jgi:hypothetical protein